MGLPAVNLNDQARVAPEKVDHERPDTHVHLGPRQAVAATEGEKTGLELRAGAVGLKAIANGKSEELRLPERGGELCGGEGPAQVFQRARRPRHGDGIGSVHWLGKRVVER